MAQSTWRVDSLMTTWLRLAVADARQRRLNTGCK